MVFQVKINREWKTVERIGESQGHLLFKSTTTGQPTSAPPGMWRIWRVELLLGAKDQDWMEDVKGKTVIHMTEGFKIATIDEGMMDDTPSMLIKIDMPHNMTVVQELSVLEFLKLADEIRTHYKDPIIREVDEEDFVKKIEARRKADDQRKTCFRDDSDG